MKRRAFLAGLPAAALSAQAPAAARPLARLDVRMPLEERIRILQTFVHERHYSPKGLLYSHINFAEERPHRPGELAGADPNPIGVPQEDHYNFENSPMNSGIFLAGQCYRYLATREPEALAYAAKAFRSIEVNYELAAQAEARNVAIDGAERATARAGWICKPYGEMLTNQTSTEQNFGPVWGMFVYRGIAPAAVRKRIDEMIVNLADLWREMGYSVNFFGERWDFERSLPRAQRHMPVWAWINRVAAEVSGQPRFRREFERLDALFGALPTPRETNLGMGRETYISTEDRTFHDKQVITGDMLIDLEPKSAARYLRGMTNWWQFAQIALREDFFTPYYIELNTVTGEFRPLPKSVKPRQRWSSPSLWANGVFPVCWSENAARLSVSSAILARRNPAVRDAALHLLKRLHARLDKTLLRYMIDPENALEPSQRFLTNLLSGDALAYYPTGYWYGRLHKLW
jgi:hypothetical protein